LNFAFVLGGALLGYTLSRQLKVTALAAEGVSEPAPVAGRAPVVTASATTATGAPRETVALDIPKACPTDTPTTGRKRRLLRGLVRKVNPFSKRRSQDFLEAEPYWDQSAIPINTYKNKEPFVGTVRSVERIVGPNAIGETCNIVIEHNGKMPYWEGQSYGVIPPGINPKNGKPNAVRLYSIASSRYGDDMTGNTATLCVRRATYWDPELEAEDPAKKGVCSNFLCDAKAGDKINLTGPSGKVMLMPEKDPNTDIIMVATGTGIAPFRGFIRRLFTEKTPYGEAYTGLAWLFLGTATQDNCLYNAEWQEVLKNNPDNFRVDYAISDRQNKRGGPLWVQDKVEEYGDEIYERLQNGAHLYFCGLKGMVSGINGVLEKVCESKGVNFEDFQKELKKNGQLHIEVY
jgi:ferredoxin--NADP+ reductase